jgi:hypothetical protein
LRTPTNKSLLIRLEMLSICLTNPQEHGLRMQQSAGVLVFNQMLPAGGYDAGCA